MLLFNELYTYKHVNTNIIINPLKLTTEIFKNLIFHQMNVEFQFCFQLSTVILFENDREFFEARQFENKSPKSMQFSKNSSPSILMNILKITYLNILSV